MKFVIYIFILLASPFVFSEVKSSEAESEVFECNPSAKIKNRVNEHCIQASDIAIDTKTPLEIDLKNGKKVVGKVFVTSKTLEDGRIQLEVSHKCNGKPKSSLQAMTFCGYQKSHLDRVSPGTKEIREELAKTNGLSEKTHQKQIDDLMAKEMNPWIADPKENIEVVDGTLKIKSLQEADGTTCYGPKELTYKTDCK